jgi:hypothetical protein
VTSTIGSVANWAATAMAIHPRRCRGTQKSGRSIEGESKIRPAVAATES